MHRMATYRAYVVGDNDHFIDSHTLECAEDEEAIEAAKALLAAHDIELWHGGRKVTRLHYRKK